MSSLRPAWAAVDLRAIQHNVERLVARAAPAAVCAVVKANGYGHGAVEVARAALAGGASWLAVALVEEGVALRRAGVTEPVLLLSEPAPAAMNEVVAAGLTPTLYTRAGAAAAVAAAAAVNTTVRAHVKVDTGMHRVGATPADAVDLTRELAASDGVEIEGLWTHLAASEDPAHDEYTAQQLGRLEEVRAQLAAAGIRPRLVHAANSGAAIGHPRSRFDLVRCGIAVYGYAPGAERRGLDLRPALSLRARVTHVQRLPAGARVSYGLRYTLEQPSVIATVPLGYADGVTRALSATGGVVLVGGLRRPIAGTITMDQLMVDCGPDAAVAVGDEVVLIGEQGGEAITADEWADRLGTISYEVVCGIGPRVPRVYEAR